MFTCSTLLLPADIHGSVQHVTLFNVPVDVLPRLFLWLSQTKRLECPGIRSPQKVLCVHMYSVAWDVLAICTDRFLTETGCELGEGSGCVGEAGGSCMGSAVRGTVGGSCPCMGELWGELCVVAVEGAV